MKPLIVLFVLVLTFSALQGKSQKKGDDQDKDADSEETSEEDEEEEDDFEGVRYMNKTNNATMGFNNATGSVQIYNATMKESKLELQVVLLEELDEDDQNVGENGEAYHDIQMVEVKEWALTEAENCSIDEGQSNITATCMSANGTVGLLNNTNIVFMVALIGQDGTVDLDGEEIPVKAGNVKVSVIVESWTWCCKDNSTGCEKCPVESEEKESKESGEEDEEEELQIGSYLHLGLSLVTPDSKIWETAKFVFNKDKTFAEGATQYGAGDGAFLLLSSQVSIDEKWTAMREGFPKIQNRDSKTMINYACDKFDSSCRYDLIFTASSSTRLEASLVFMFILAIVTFWHSH